MHSIADFVIVPDDNTFNRSFKAFLAAIVETLLISFESTIIQTYGATID
jgi:hypothetical protein